VGTISSLPTRPNSGGLALEWYRQVQFISAVPMPREMAEEFGTTINGMWADPERRSPDEVAADHRHGRRALFSVPIIALTPRTYEQPEAAHLLDEVCRDVDGEQAECDWYYWESKPVFAGCIYSDVFRAYLLDRCKRGVDRGMDVVNLDEIMTSVGLMTLAPRGSGFCARCLDRFRSNLTDEADSSGLAVADVDALRKAIRSDNSLFDRYRRFHEHEAFRVMVDFIEELRSYARTINPHFAISANVAYLGSYVARFGSLWGCLWGPHLDFVMMENDYRIERGPHVLLPRGKFTAAYRLGASFTGAPNWICPSINVPRQLAGEDHRRYYELMFLEAYANGGRWGYYWWPGVDADTRRHATAPEALKTYIGFIEAHRDLFERSTSMNDLAVLYLEGPVLRRPQTHEKFLGLAQAMAEAGFQYDVLYGGDGAFNSDEIDATMLKRYRAIVLAEARDLGAAPEGALESFAREGGEIVVFSDSPIAEPLVREEDGSVLVDFWRHYRDVDRDRIRATLDRFALSRIQTSDPMVNVIRHALGDRQVLHLLNYAYDATTDTITPATDVRLTIPWEGDAPATCTLLAPDWNEALPGRVVDRSLVIQIPRIDPYAVLVVEGHGSGRS
jgi:hypothetical protein